MTSKEALKQAREINGRKKLKIKEVEDKARKKKENEQRALEKAHMLKEKIEPVFVKSLDDAEVKRKLTDKDIKILIIAYGGKPVPGKKDDRYKQLKDLHEKRQATGDGGGVAGA